MADTISITGMGIVCAIGNDVAQVRDSLLRGESGIRAIKYLDTCHSDIPVGEVQLSNEQMKAMLGINDAKPLSRTSLMGAIAVRQAAAQAGISDMAGKRIALISGTTVGDLDVTEKYFEQMKTCDELLSLPHSNECGTSTREIASMSGLDNAAVCTVSTACSAALNAIIVGCEMLRNNEADIVIAGGSESLSKFHLNGFNTLMILDRQRCRPFDDTRAGLNLGEGAAFVVLQKNAGNGLAYIAGYGNRCDAFHQTASSDNGEGAFLAMSDALGMACLKPSDIQYVNAHGTGTSNNDQSESQALKRVFAGLSTEISSTKSFTGHTTSASGAIETVISVLSLQNGFTPANLGWSSPMPDGIIPTLGRTGLEIDNVMCNSFGFGGNDSSLILSRKVACLSPYTEEEPEIAVISQDTVSSVEELAALKEFVSPMESRRMGKLMKAALLSALRALKTAGIECPDTIITATSRGMLEISQQFLDDINANGEQLLKPTLFMNSTHNTVGSAIAIRTGCHGYNITYSQGDESEAWAMRDAERLLKTGKACNALVVSFDESTEIFDSFSKRSGNTVPRPLFARSTVLKNNCR